MTVGGATKTATAPAAPADVAVQAAGEQEGGLGEQREQPPTQGAGGQSAGAQAEVVPPSGGGEIEKAGDAPGAAGVGAVGAPKTRAGVAPSTKRAESAAKKKAGKQVGPAAVEKAKDAAASSQRQLVPADPSIAANTGGTRRPSNTLDFALEIRKELVVQLQDFDRFLELLKVCYFPSLLRFIVGRLRLPARVLSLNFSYLQEESNQKVLQLEKDL